MPNTSPLPTVLFVCLHGSAKSLIAAEHFSRLARERGLPYRGESAGVEPDLSVPATVVAGLERDGFAVSDYVPRQVTSERAAQAAYIVSFGCELSVATLPARRERWDDLPMVSDGFEHARDAIVARVERLIDRLQSAATPGQ